MDESGQSLPGPCGDSPRLGDVSGGPVDSFTPLGHRRARTGVLEGSETLTRQCGRWIMSGPPPDMFEASSALLGVSLGVKFCHKCNVWWP